jgi:hypothetical protein
MVGYPFFKRPVLIDVAVYSKYHVWKLCGIHILHIRTVPDSSVQSVDAQRSPKRNGYFTFSNLHDSL